MLRYRYIAGKKLLTPFEAGSARWETEPDLRACAASLFPHKSGLFKERDPGILAVRCIPRVPFGPDAALLLDNLFGDFRQAVIDVREKLGLRKIVIAGLEKKRRFRETGVFFTSGRMRHRHRGIELGLDEFSRLHTALAKGTMDDRGLVSIFLGVKEILCFYVPGGTILGDIFESEPSLKEFITRNPDARAYHPLSGVEFDPGTDVAGPECDLICFSDSGHALAPAHNPLFPFPWFDHVCSMKQTDTVTQEPLPCSNCLACARYCPSGLYPSNIYHSITRGDPHETLGINIGACIRCGVCSFVCPSGLPLYGEIRKALAGFAGEN